MKNSANTKPWGIVSPSDSKKMAFGFDFDQTITKAHIYGAIFQEIARLGSQYPHVELDQLRAMAVNNICLPLGPDDIKNLAELRATFTEIIENGHGLAITSFTEFPEAIRHVLHLIASGCTPSVAEKIRNLPIVFGGPDARLSPKEALPGCYKIEHNVYDLTLEKAYFDENAGKNLWLDMVQNLFGITSKYAVTLVDDSPKNIEKAIAAGFRTVPVSKAPDAPADYLERVREYTKAAVRTVPHILSLDNANPLNVSNNAQEDIVTTLNKTYLPTGSEGRWSQRNGVVAFKGISANYGLHPAPGTTRSALIMGEVEAQFITNFAKQFGLSYHIEEHREGDIYVFDAKSLLVIKEKLGIQAPVPTFTAVATAVASNKEEKTSPEIATRGRATNARAKTPPPIDTSKLAVYALYGEVEAEFNKTMQYAGLKASWNYDATSKSIKASISGKDPKDMAHALEKLGFNARDMQVTEGKSSLKPHTSDAYFCKKTTHVALGLTTYEFEIPVSHSAVQSMKETAMQRAS